MSHLRRSGNSLSRDNQDGHKSSFTPRSLAHKGKKRGSGQAMTSKRKKKVSFFMYIGLVMAVVALARFVMNNAEWLPLQKKKETEQKAPPIASEKPEVGPIIEEGDEEDSKYGQDFIVRNVNKLTVIIRAVRGESTLFMGKLGSEKRILREGDQQMIEGNEVWFRLGSPSNVDILVNNKSITTRAQDQEKGYHILRK